MNIHLHPFHRFIGDLGRWQAAEAAAGFRADIEEDDGQYRIRADLPGVDKDQITARVDGDVLSVRAKMERGEAAHRERFCGELSRSFRLPANADSAGIAASLKDGVLTLEIPKATDSARRIDIL